MILEMLFWGEFSSLCVMMVDRWLFWVMMAIRGDFVVCVDRSSVWAYLVVRRRAREWWRVGLSQAM